MRFAASDPGNLPAALPPVALPEQNFNIPPL